MLIKREIVGDVIEALYESSNIAASRFNETSGNLAIVFNNGTEYVYSGVDRRDYLNFELAESQGKVFNKYIKQYPFAKGDTVDVVTLKKQITSAKMEEINRLGEEIVQVATQISLTTPENPLDEVSLEAIETLIKLRKEKLAAL